MTENVKTTQEPASAREAEDRKQTRLRRALAVALAVLLALGLLVSNATAAETTTTYSSTATVSSSYGTQRIKLVVTVDNDYSATQAKVSWTATHQMKSAYQWGVKLTCMGYSSTGVLTSNPGSSYKDVCSVSGSKIVDKGTSSSTYTVSASSAGATVSGFGGTPKSLSVSKTVTISAISAYYLDVNGLLDGESVGNTAGYGTFDVYVGGTRVANDVTDYYTQHTVGSSYEIKDIKASTGKTYEGVNSGSLTGTMSAAKSVRLSFTTNTYKVAYNANGGSGSMSTATHTYGTAKNLTANAFKRTGYYFSGWNTKADGSGTAYADKASVNNLTATDDATVTLYAQWTPYKLTVNQRTNGADYGTFAGADLGLTGADALAKSWSVAYDGSADPYNAQTTSNLYISRTGYSPTGYWGTTTTGGVLVDETVSYSGKELAALVGKSIDTANASVNLYAQWRAHTYYVAFDANGGKGDVMNGLRCTYDLAYPLDPCTYVRDGYRFAGWNTERDGTGAAYADGEGVSNLTAEDGATVTLYAQWDPYVLTVRYHSNGADACTLAGNAISVTGGSDAIVHTEYHKYGTMYADGLCDVQNPGWLNLSRTGYTPTGYWATGPDGGVYVNQDTGFSSGQALAAAFGLALVEGDCEIDVYPQWKVNSYKVAYDANGGKGKMAGSNHSYDETWTLPACTFTNAGYFFEGWNTKADGSGTAYSDMQEVSGMAGEDGATVTLYAQWSAGSYRVSFDGNGATSGSLPDAEYDHDEAWTVPDNPFSNTASVTFDANGGTAASALPSLERDLDFTGWSKRADGKGSAYAEGQRVVNLAGSSKSVTLYAQWEPIEVTMPEAPSNGDYVFAGWYDGQSTFAGEDLYQPGDVVEITDSATFCAHWRPADVVIVYADDRIVLEEEPAADGTYSVTDAAIAAATREGCEGLDGFYADSDCTVPFVDGTAVDGELRIYARNPVTISFGVVDNSFVEGLALYADEELEVPVDAAELLPSPVKTYYGQMIGAPAIEAAYYSELGQAQAVAATPGVYADASGQGDLISEITATAPATYYYDWTLGGTVIVLEYATAAYTVRYDINGGHSGETPDSEHLWGHAKRLTPNGYSRDFHVFSGWNTRADGTGEAFEDEQYVANLTSEDGATVTLYAQWRPWTYFVNYHPNGATEGATEATEMSYGTVGTISENGFSQEAWTFLRWNTAPDGSGEDFWPGQNVLNLCHEDDGLFDLYAIWDIAEYTVRYEPNGGSGSMDPSVHVYGMAKNLTENAFARTGYEFMHWATEADGSGTAYSNGQEVVNLTDVDDAVIPLFAQWDPISYTIHYDANGGKGDTPSSFHTYDDPKNLTPNGFVKQDCRFTGWNEKADGSGEAYSDMQEVKNLASTEGAEITIYAQWEEIPAAELIRYTIRYDGNGADSGQMENSTHTAGFPSPLSANEYGKTGGFFVSWNTERDGSGTGYSNKQRVDFTDVENGDVITLYAQWSPIQFDVVYDGNGADGGETWGDTLTYDEAGTVAENGFTRTGYDYVSWNSKADGTGETYRAGDEILNWTEENGAVITLYAQWSPIEYDVFYGGNGNDSGSMEPSHHVYDEEKNLTKNAYGRTGYTFAGWREAEASGDAEASGEAYAIYDDEAKALYFVRSETQPTGTFTASDGTEITCTAVYDGVETLAATVLDFETTIPWYGSRTVITSVDVIDEISPISTAYWFQGMSECAYIDLDKLDTSNVADMSYMFEGSWKIADLNVADWDVSRVENMEGMFANCYWMITDFSGWNTSNVTNMSYMFYNTFWNTTAIDLSSFDTSSVKNMSYMFYACSTITTIYASDLWSTDSVTSSSNMFGDCTKLKGDVSYNGKIDKTYAKTSGGYLTHKAAPEKDLTPAPEDPEAEQRFFTDEQEVVNLTAIDGDVVTLLAQWSPIAYFVAYEPNGGSGSMSPSTHTYDIAKNLTENAFTRNVTATFDANGGTPSSRSASVNTPFNLWTANANGSGTAYADRESVTNLSTVNLSTITMYAQWKPGTVTLPAAPTHAELVFTGWYDAASGGNLIGQPGDVTEISSDTTLYAHWRPPAVVLVYADGELVLEEYPDENGIYSVTDEAVEAATRPSCEGLNGWYLDEECTIELPDSYLIEGEVPIYTRNKATVTFEESLVSVTISRILYADATAEDGIDIYDVIPDPIETYYGEKITVPDVPGVYFIDAGRVRHATAGSGAYATPNATGARLSEATVLGTATLWYDWQIGGYDGILTD